MVSYDDQGNDLYVHVFDWLSDSLIVTVLPSKVLSARLLATNQPLHFRQTSNELLITLPPEAPDPSVSVVALRTI